MMVDAGYLLRQSIEIVSNRASNKRAELNITDPAGLVRALITKCKEALDLADRELLRVYWYDGVMSNGLTQQQRSIIGLPDVHFRAGVVNASGQQKGVDSLIVTDLIELASNHAICDAALVTGDGDLAVGIEIAQKKGVRIAVIGFEDLSVGVSHKQSFEITSRADRIGRLGGADLSTLMHYTPSTSSVKPLASSASNTSAAATPANVSRTTNVSRPTNTPLDSTVKPQILQSVKSFIAQQVSTSGIVDLKTKRIDATADRSLIHHVYTELAHGQLTNAEKIYARDAFRTELGI